MPEQLQYILVCMWYLEDKSGTLRKKLKIDCTQEDFPFWGYLQTGVHMMKGEERDCVRVKTAKWNSRNKASCSGICLY